jgi:hypothetical protein
MSREERAQILLHVYTQVRNRIEFRITGEVTITRIQSYSMQNINNMRNITVDIQ